MKTVQMTVDEPLLVAVDALIQKTGETRSAFVRTALHAELKRRRNQHLEAMHRQSHLEQPDTDAWHPTIRAWGEP
jgi:metal-responsive CopG/Arc/MetJ family transcriptional regulator